MITGTHRVDGAVRASKAEIGFSVVSAEGRLTLQLEREGRAVQTLSLGITVNGERLGTRTSIGDVAERDVVEAFSMVAGKATGSREAAHRELTLSLREATGTEWALVVRVACDGVAFRYGVPVGGCVALQTESTSFRPDNSDRLWTLEYQTWYETPRFSTTFGELAAGDYGFPTLIERGDDWLLLTEAAIDGRASGAHLVKESGRLVVRAADPETQYAGGQLTPWRVAIIGSLADVVASTLVDELAPARDDTVDYSFVRPGRGAWSWWSSQYSGAYLDDQKRFAEFAAAQGWEHVLVDCGWDATWVPELVSFASARGVQVHLWSSWSDLDGPEALRKLGLWKSWGVAGIKVDFMESESQERYRWYDAIIAESARVGLMVNFHGSVIPRGWARTHPHVVSYEGIRGSEYYVFYGTPLTASHNVIQPFTRNAVGSMDYTPVAFSAPQRETSEGHELGLGFAYESGITHFADDPAQYEQRPLAAAMLAEVAPAWDETVLLGGHPDHEAVIGRRANDRWFVGCIATGDARDIRLDLSEVMTGPVDLWIVGDDGSGGLAERRITVDASEPISVPIERNGGFAAIVAPAGAGLQRATRNLVTRVPELTPALATVRPGEHVDVTTDPDLEVVVAPGWSAERRGPGVWRVGAPADTAAGASGVVTAVRRGSPDAFGHARLYIELPVGEHEASALAFLSCRNAVGPVERDESNGGGDPHDGTTPTVGGVAYERAIGVSDDSSVVFALGGVATTLRGGVGLDDELPGGTAVVSVLVDGELRERLTLREGAVVPFSVSLVGAMTVELRTEPGDHPAHVDWLDTLIVRAQ